MTRTDDTAINVLMEPIKHLFDPNPFARKCEVLTDRLWIDLGIKRILGECNSGRSFLQCQAANGEMSLWTGQYFDALKSQRRLDHLLWINQQLINSEAAWADCEDPISPYCPELDGYVINIGDGHHHKAPVHEVKIDGKVYSTQHFYAQNARSGMLWPITLAEYGDTRKKEHDMHALKRQDTEMLRAGAKKGEKSLWIWDRACMNFPQWHIWKMKGIYFLTVEKELNAFKVIRRHEFDRNDKVNAGVISDEEVESGSKGILLRRVKYRCPETRKVYSFVTNLNKKIRPGVIAFLYKCRWGIEKTYNTFKHKLGEQRAWAVSPEAKMTQANFLCLTHNLTVILNRKIDQDADAPELSPNYEAKQKKEKRLTKLIKYCKEKGREVPALLLTATRLAELPKKFIIWLREVIRNQCSWIESMRRLELCCDKKH